jgi:DnaJ-domain-containing protein 1
MSGSRNNNNNDDDAQSAALMELLAPDGYYAYLRINKSLLNATTAASTARSVPNDHASKNQHESSSSMHSSSSSSSTAGAAATTADDEQQQEFDNIKKNYRKLSLKHHPDRGGDANTFRLLNRSQRVLSNPRLRKQYDILGIDLDDDDDNEHRNDDGGEGTPAAGAASSGSSSNAGGASGDDRETTAQGIVHEIASMVLTSIIQLGVRTSTYALLLLLLLPLFLLPFFILCLVWMHAMFAHETQSPFFSLCMLVVLFLNIY